MSTSKLSQSAGGHDHIPETKTKPTTEGDTEKGSTAEGAIKALDMFLEADAKCGGSNYPGLVLGGVPASDLDDGLSDEGYLRAAEQLAPIFGEI